MRCTAVFRYARMRRDDAYTIAGSSLFQRPPVIARRVMMDAARALAGSHGLADAILPMPPVRRSTHLWAKPQRSAGSSAAAAALCTAPKRCRGIGIEQKESRSLDVVASHPDVAQLVTGRLGGAPRPMDPRRPAERRGQHRPVPADDCRASLRGVRSHRRHAHRPVPANRSRRRRCEVRRARDEV